MVAPAVVANSVTVQQAQNTSPVVATVPPGILENDIWVLVLAHRQNAEQTFPAGWTLREFFGGITPVPRRLEIWWKRCAASESGPSVSTSASSGGYSVQSFLARGCRTIGDPFDVSLASGLGDVAVTTMTSPVITPTVAETLLIHAWISSDDNAHAVSAAAGLAALMSGADYDTIVGADHAMAAAVENGPAAGVVSTGRDSVQTINGPDGAASITLALAPAESGTAQARTAIDALGLADARALRRIKALIEPIGMLDSVARQRKTVVSVADSLGISDAPAPLKIASRTRTATDQIPLSDERTFGVRLGRSDPLGLTDPRAESRHHARARDEGLGLSDAPTRAMMLARLPADSLGSTDAPAPAIRVTRALTDALGARDSSTPARQAKLALTEALDLLDSRSPALFRRAARADALGMTDAAAPTLLSVIMRSTVDALGLGDTLIRSLAGRAAPLPALNTLVVDQEDRTCDVKKEARVFAG